MPGHWLSPQPFLFSLPRGHFHFLIPTPFFILCFLFSALCVLSHVLLWHYAPFLIPFSFLLLSSSHRQLHILSSCCCCTASNRFLLFLICLTALFLFFVIFFRFTPDASSMLNHMLLFFSILNRMFSFFLMLNRISSFPCLTACS